MHIIIKAFPIVFAVVILSSCNSGGQAKIDATSSQTQEAIQPGAVATSATGYTMTATIGGKEWQATSMMPPENAGRIVGYFKNQYIGLPFNKTDMVVGKKIILGEDEAADLSLHNGCLWINTKGEMEITKVTDEAAEGKFFFTTSCSSDNKKVEIRDGFFRILFNKK